MPPRQDILTKGLLSLGELPILPFLAPRVFKSWLEHLRISRAQGTGPTTASSGHGLAGASLPAPTTRRESRVLNFGSRRASRPCDAEVRSIRPSGFRPMSTSVAPSGIYTDDKRFRRAYEDIWGPDRARGRFPGQVYFPPEEFQKEVTKKDERTPSVIQEKTREPRVATTVPMGVLPAEPVRLPRHGRYRGSSHGRKVSRVRKVLISCATNKFIRLHLGQGTHTTDQNSGLESLSSQWLYWFTQISRKYHSQLEQYKVPPSIRIHGVIKSPGSFERSLSKASVQEIRKAWEAFPETERELIWMPIMLGALRSWPRWAVKFLTASTSSEPYPPSYAVSDVLEYIVCFYLSKVNGPDVGKVTTTFRTVMAFLARHDPSYLRLSQKTIFLLLSNITVDQAEHLYKTLLNHNHTLNENTLLQFARAFAQKGRTQLAVDALRSFHKNGGCFTRPKVESVCATLLRRKFRSSSDGALSDSDIFGFLLDLGLRPNITLYNILLRNAIESGDSETAWKIHDMMPGLGIEADAYTYSILLNDAKLRMDRPMMERIVGIVQSKDISNEFIITDLLHAMFLIYEQEKKANQMHTPPPAPLTRMLPIYAKYFDLEVIRELLNQGDMNLVVPSDRPKMHPSTATIIVMLVALLRGFTSPTSTPEWYRRFRRMVLSGHPDITPLAESTHIYDAVIMSLGRWPVTLSLCTRVISDMFSSYSTAQQAPKQLRMPNLNGRTLQTTMGSNPGFASIPHAGAHRFLSGNADSKIDWRLNGLPEERLAAEFVGLVDGGGPKSTDFSPLPSEVDIEASNRSAEHAVIYGHCKPSVHTWSILLKAFMDHNQPRAAEEVLTMMRRQGITPSQVTWNSLAIGYARLQDITNTVNAIERLENEGLEVDDVTIKGLQVIENRDGFSDALKEMGRRRAKKQEWAQEAIERELAAPGTGSLREVIYKEELVSSDENRLGKSSAAQRESTKGHSYKSLMRNRIHEDERDRIRDDESALIEKPRLHEKT